MIWRGLELEYGGTLQPYPEASALVDLCAAYGPYKTALDIGTGSGCIALALKAEGMADTVVATDIDPTACDVAWQNANRLGLDVDIRSGDMYKPVPERYELTVFNAPYVRTADVQNLDDPPLAVDGGEDGLDLIRRAVDEYPGWLGGVLAVGIGTGHRRAVDDMFGSARFEVAATGRCPRFGVIRHMIGIRT